MRTRASPTPSPDVHDAHDGQSPTLPTAARSRGTFKRRLRNIGNRIRSHRMLTRWPRKRRGRAERMLELDTSGQAMEAPFARKLARRDRDTELYSHTQRRTRARDQRRRHENAGTASGSHTMRIIASGQAQMAMAVTAVDLGRPRPRQDNDVRLLDGGAGEANSKHTQRGHEWDGLRTEIHDQPICNLRSRLRWHLLPHI
jgi:hypothetical protein